MKINLEAELNCSRPNVLPEGFFKNICEITSMSDITKLIALNVGLKISDLSSTPVAYHSELY
jgi:hypothetical protein